jgi:hypothetical protein
MASKILLPLVRFAPVRLYDDLSLALWAKARITAGPVKSVLTDFRDGDLKLG